MKQVITALLLFLCTLSIYSQNSPITFDNELYGLLTDVDRELDRADIYSKNRESRISELRGSLAASNND